MTNLVTQFVPVPAGALLTSELIAAVVTLLALFITTAFAYLAKKAALETRRAVNGRMDEFKAMAEALYHAQGLAQGRREEKTEAAITASAKAKGAAEERGRS